MELLSVYDSISEDEIDYEDISLEINTKNNSDNPVCSINEQLSMNITDGGTCDNFFGLIKHDGNINSQSESKFMKIDTNEILTVDGIEMDIPKSKFWEKIYNDKQIGSPISSIDNLKEQNVSCMHPWKTFVRLNETIPVAKEHKEGSVVECGATFSLDQRQSNLRCTQFRCNSNKNNSMSVYAVHPKISPHLAQQQNNLCPSKDINCWSGHSGVINRIAWCTNMAYSHLLASASMDSVVRIWNVWSKNRSCVRTLSTHAKAVRDIHWNVDGRLILSSSYDRDAAITDIETGQCQVRLEHGEFVSTASYHPVYHNLIVSGTFDCLQVWDVRHPDVPVRILTYKEMFGQVQDILFSSDGCEVFSCSNIVSRECADRSIMAWDFKSGVVLSNQIFQERYTVSRLCMHPSQAHFMAQTQAGYIAIFSTHRPYKMNRSKRFEGHQCDGYSIGMSVSSDGNYIYSGSSDGTLHCYNFNNGKPIQKIKHYCSGQVLVDVAAHPLLPSLVAASTYTGDIVLFQ